MVKVSVFDSTEARKSKREPADAPKTDARAFYDVVESRRSVRIYTDEPVPEQVMRRAMDVALLAPSSSNLQICEMHWVRTPEKKATLAQHCLGQPAAVTAQEIVVFVARPDRWRENNEHMLNTLKANPDAPAKALQYFGRITKIVYNQGPFGILRPFKFLWFSLRGIKKPTPREPIHLGQMSTWAHKSTALAAENFMLAIRAEGFDSCPMEGLDSKRVKQLLGLPRRAGINMAISVGKRAKGGVYGPRFRFDSKRAIFEH